MSTATQLELQGYFTDATPSWNGYNHQGKVGIFVALKMINDQNMDFDMCTAYKLELEWLEDFSILKNDERIYIHQVKTYKETAPSTYKDAIWLLLAKSLDFPKIKGAYLHSTSLISNLNTLRTTLFDYVPPKEASTTSEIKEDTPSSGNEKSKKYWTPKQCHDYVKSSSRYDEAFDKFQVYSYGDSQRYCRMDEIENKIKEQLITFFGSGKTEEHINRGYLHLIGLVDKHIRERHIDIQAGMKDPKAMIGFQQIYEIISNNFELPSRQYCIYILRDRFAKLTNEYLEDLSKEEEEPGIVVDKQNLFRVINAVSDLDDESFLKFCMKITPHHEVRDDNPEGIIDALSHYISETDMTDGYLEILKQIRREIHSQKHAFFKMGSDNQNISYLPTTIIDEYRKSKVDRMVDRILQNSNLVDEVLHEIDVMITRRITLSALRTEKFNNGIPDPDIDEQEEQLEEIPKRSNLDPKDYHNRITKIKNIRMIDLKNAKGELDE